MILKILAAANTILFAVFLAWAWVYADHFAPHRSDVSVEAYEACLKSKGVPTLGQWTNQYTGCVWRDQ